MMRFETDYNYVVYTYIKMLDEIWSSQASLNSANANNNIMW